MVAIIGVLAAVAIPAYNGYRTTAAENSVRSEVSEMVKALQACVTVHNTADCVTLDIKMTISKTCTSAPSSKADTVGCYIDDTTDQCVSAAVQGVGAVVHGCQTFDLSTGIVGAYTKDKQCKNDGSCTL